MSDDAQQDRTHPVFYSLQEEWEKCVQTIQNLSPWKALVKVQGCRLRIIRTIQVQDGGCSEKQLETLKSYQVRRLGVRHASIQQTSVRGIRGNDVNEGPTFWELT